MSSTEQHTPAFKLFHYEFNYQIPAMHFYTEQQQENFGVFSSGDREVDRMQAAAPVMTRSNIMEMARRYAQDIQIELCNPEDSVRIYEIIKAHLLDWYKAARTEHNLGDVPTEDLRMLDDFAVSLFQLARRYQPQIVEQSRFMRLFGQLGGSMDRHAPVSRTEETEAAPKVKEHNPIAEHIQDFLYQRGLTR